MRILIVSYFAESREWSSTAQNTRLLANALLGAEHDVRVVCASSDEGSIVQDGYPITRIPIRSEAWPTQWLGQWQPNRKVSELAEEYFRLWQPQVILMGAWNSLLEFAISGLSRDIPVVQVLHDYSIFCLRTWLVDSWGSNCSGPDSLGKCASCIRHSLGWKDRVKDMVLSLPNLGRVIDRHLGKNSRYKVHVRSKVERTLIYLDDYRRRTSLFIAQSPFLLDILRTNGIPESRCASLPQFIGEEKLRQYPRPEGRPGSDRPFRIIYVGRWSAIKGVHVLLEAFLSAEVVSSTELWIVSRNASASEIEALTARRLGSKKQIRVFADLTGPDVSRRMAQADVCVVPSVWQEIAARVVLEAHAQRVPVIATDLVGNRYVITDGENGRIVAAGDTAALAACIEEMVGDPSLVSDWSRRVERPIGRREWLAKIESILFQVSGSGPPQSDKEECLPAG